MLLGAEGDYTVPVQETDMWWSNLLVGVTEPAQVDATTGSYTNFILGVLPDETVNWSISAGGILDGGKAYLQLPTASVEKLADSSVPLRWIFDDDEATGIEDVENEGLKVGKDDAAYNLQGRLEACLEITIHCGKTNHIQCVRLRPSVISRKAFS